MHTHVFFFSSPFFPVCFVRFGSFLSLLFRSPLAAALWLIISLASFFSPRGEVLCWDDLNRPPLSSNRDPWPLTRTVPGGVLLFTFLGEVTFSAQQVCIEKH